MHGRPRRRRAPAGAPDPLRETPGLVALLLYGSYGIDRQTPLSDVALADFRERVIHHCDFVIDYRVMLEDYDEGGDTKSERPAARKGKVWRTSWRAKRGRAGRGVGGLDPMAGALGGRETGWEVRSPECGAASIHGTIHRRNDRTCSPGGLGDLQVEHQMRVGAQGVNTWSSRSAVELSMAN